MLTAGHRVSELRVITALADVTDANRDRRRSVQSARRLAGDGRATRRRSDVTGNAAQILAL